MALFDFLFGKGPKKAASPDAAELGNKLRAQLLETAILPELRIYFSEFPSLKSAFLLVAQYWNDEAHDAVHSSIIYSELPRPVVGGNGVHDEANFPTINRESFYEFEGAYEVMNNWDSNGIAISAFSCYCKEHCDQEMDYLEAYSPYALFTRNGDDITVEVVGKILRPWLDGVRPQEE